MNLTELPAGPNPPEELYAIVEIPPGGREKYEYDEKLGLFRLDRILYSSVHYPGAYGFVPHTRAGDKDPVDILVVGDFESFTGALIEVRPVGMLLMVDEKGDDEKVLAVPIADPRYGHIQELDDLGPHIRREVEHFFYIYKDLEGGHVETLGWKPRQEAQEYVMSCLIRDGGELGGA
jgi:inorganic pyrophosphatase